MQGSEFLVPRLSLWALVAASAAALLVLLWLAGLGLDPPWALNLILVYLAAISALTIICRPRPGSWQDKALRLVEHVSIASAISMFGALASYAIVACAGAYTDPLLARADALLGFDWVALYRFTQANPGLQAAGRIAYLSMFLSPAILLVALTVTGRIARVQGFILAHWLALTVTLAIFALFPAQAPLVYYLGTDPAYMPASGVHHVATIDALQSGMLTTVKAHSPYGLIAFPSFHAASAVIFMWAAWPLRALRAPIILINAMMLAATPIEGTHYLVDVIAGVAVALLAISCARPAGAWLTGVWQRAARIAGRAPQQAVAAE